MVFKFWWCFFVKSLPNHVTMPELSSWSATLASIINKKPTILTKLQPVTITVPSSTNTVIGALIYWVYLWICDSGQSNPPPGVLLPR